MLSAITRLRNLWSRLADREYREAYLDEAVNAGISAQIFALRMSRGLTQSDVARRTGLAQPTLSRLESDAHGVTTTTLKRLAKNYDVALSVKFISYKELAEEVSAGKVDRYIPSFEKDVAPKALAIEALITAQSTCAKNITVDSKATTLADDQLAGKIQMTKAAGDPTYVRPS